MRRGGEKHGHLQHLAARDVVREGRRAEPEASISRWLYSHAPRSLVRVLLHLSAVFFFLFC